MVKMPKSKSVSNEANGTKYQNGTTKRKAPRNSRASETMESCTGTILAKLDLEHLKGTVLKTMSSGENAPSGREECIDHVLEMILSNLTMNGHLGSQVIAKMREPQMKEEINKLCDEMIAARTEIMSKANIKGRRTKAKSKKATSNRSSSQTSNSSATKQAPLTMEQLEKFPRQHLAQACYSKLAKIVKERWTEPTVKSSDESISRKVKVQKPRSKSDLLTVERRISWRTEIRAEENAENAMSVITPSSTVPSEADVLRSDTELASKVPQAIPEEPTGMPQDPEAKLVERDVAVKPKPTILKHRDSPKHDDICKNVTIVGITLVDDNGNFEHESLEKPKSVHILEPEKFPDMASKDIIEAPYLPPSTEECSLPALSSLVRSTTPTRMKGKTLDSFIATACPMPSTVPKGYQIAVDLKGFQNHEISMEVQGRQLIFLASRPKRDDMTVRKVTEIIEVPAGVNMENLKIGRRVDGCVVIEEHEL